MNYVTFTNNYITILGQKKFTLRNHRSKIGYMDKINISFLNLKSSIIPSITLTPQAIENCKI